MHWVVTCVLRTFSWTLRCLRRIWMLMQRTQLPRSTYPVAYPLNPRCQFLLGVPLKSFVSVGLHLVQPRWAEHRVVTLCATRQQKTRSTVSGSASINSSAPGTSTRMVVSRILALQAVCSSPTLFILFSSAVKGEDCLAFDLKTWKTAQLGSCCWYLCVRQGYSHTRCCGMYTRSKCHRAHHE